MRLPYGWSGRLIEKDHTVRLQKRVGKVLRVVRYRFIPELAALKAVDKNGATMQPGTCTELPPALRDEVLAAAKSRWSK